MIRLFMSGVWCLTNQRASFCEFKILLAPSNILIMKFKSGVRVSIKAVAFDDTRDPPDKRWSRSNFGDHWSTAVVLGTITAPAGKGTWKVKWDIDGGESAHSYQSLNLVLVEKTSATSTPPTAVDHFSSYAIDDIAHLSSYFDQTTSDDVESAASSDSDEDSLQDSDNPDAADHDDDWRLMGSRGLGQQLMGPT